MDAVVAIVPVLIRTVATRGRMIAMGALGLIGVAIGVMIRRSDIPADFVPAEMIADFGLTLLVPVVALVVASATLGNLVENRTLVYLWLRPLASWQIVVSALIAGLVIVLPLLVFPLAALAAIVGDSADVGATVVAAILGSIGYVSVFTLLGLLSQRALAFGLVYILIWEGFVAGLSRTAGQYALRTYTSSALAQISDATELIDRPYQVATTVLVMIGVSIAACGITSWRLSTQDVD